MYNWLIGREIASRTQKGGSVMTLEWIQAVLRYLPCYRRRRPAQSLLAATPDGRRGGGFTCASRRSVLFVLP